MNRKRMAGRRFWFCLIIISLLGAGHGRAEDSWTGYAPLRGGKGYAGTPMGEVHYRDIGPRDAKVTVLLLHMTPMSIIQFADVQPALADLGIRSIAVDTPGYGMSDVPLKAHPDISEFADNLIPVLDHLNIRKVVVAGHHTGASIATSFATRHADRVSGIVLHGVPMFEQKDIAALDKGSSIDRTPRQDGTHLSRFFHPDAEPPKSPEYLNSMTWFAVSLYIEGRDIGHYAVYHYDLAADLKKLKTRGLILTDSGDELHAIDQSAAKLRPDFIFKNFSIEGGGLSIMIHPKDWAKIVADFCRTTDQNQ